NVTVKTLHANSLDLSWSVPLSTFPVVSYNIFASYSIANPTPTPMSASALTTANPTPIATSLTASFSDQSMGVSTGFYVVVGVDDQGHSGALPSLIVHPNDDIKSRRNSHRLIRETCGQGCRDRGRVCGRQSGSRHRGWRRVRDRIARKNVVANDRECR